jgi:hypothetical protein
MKASPSSVSPQQLRFRWVPFLAIGALTIASIGTLLWSNATSSQKKSPLETSRAWFDAMTHDDATYAMQYLSHQVNHDAAWPLYGHVTYKHVHCFTLNSSTESANVACGFLGTVNPVSPASSLSNWWWTAKVSHATRDEPTSWDVSLHRHHGGPWQIYEFSADSGIVPPPLSIIPNFAR